MAHVGMYVFLWTPTSYLQQEDLVSLLPLFSGQSISFPSLPSPPLGQQFQQWLCVPLAPYQHNPRDAPCPASHLGQQQFLFSNVGAMEGQDMVGDERSRCLISCSEWFSLPKPFHVELLLHSWEVPDSGHSFGSVAAFCVKRCQLFDTSSPKTHSDASDGKRGTNPHGTPGSAQPKIRMLWCVHQHGHGVGGGGTKPLR